MAADSSTFSEMNFFNPDTSSAIQYLTFPLEVIGFSLALIEIRFPNAAQRISKLQARSFKPFSESLSKLDKNSLRGKANESIGLLVTFIIVIFGIISIAALWAMGELQNSILFGNSVFGSLYVLFVIVFGTYILMGLSSRWVKGREVGTLGLILASLGLLGESYQYFGQVM